MKKILFILFTTASFGQTYVKTIKLSNVLSTTAVSNPSIYKQNIFELKEFKNNTAAINGGLKLGMFYSLPLQDGISLIAVVKPRELLTMGKIENQTIYLSEIK